MVHRQADDAGHDGHHAEAELLRDRATNAISVLLGMAWLLPQARLGVTKSTIFNRSSLRETVFNPPLYSTVRLTPNMFNLYVYMVEKFMT